MNEPSGELLELDMYFSQLTRADALARVVRHCLAHGGTLSGELLQYEGAGIRNQLSTRREDQEVKRVRISSGELERKLEDKDTDIVRVAIWSAIGLVVDVPELVDSCGISSTSAQLDNNPISIITEGGVFSGPGDESESQSAGVICYRKFVDFCTQMDPDYAAILHEDSLPCRADLKLGLGRRCFTTFFVSDRAYGPEIVRRVTQLYADAYVEQLSNGIYVSTWHVFNPREINIERTVALKRSAVVARILASGVE